jgi:hypothetical protein
MKVMTLSTESPTLRSEVVGWNYEDSDLFVKGKRIGDVPSPVYEFPATVLEALASGWKLLGPPLLENIRPEYKEDCDELWVWWLTK